MEHFELVVGQAVDARSAINQFSLVARLSCGSAAAGFWWALDGEGDLGHQLGVEHDDVEPRLDVCRQGRVPQLCHPLTVTGHRTPVAGSTSRPRRRRGGAAQVCRKVTDIRHRYDNTHAIRHRWCEDVFYWISRFFSSGSCMSLLRDVT